MVSIAFSDLPQCSASVWDNADGSGLQMVKAACIYTGVFIKRISTLIKLSRYIFTPIFTPFGWHRQSFELQKFKIFFISVFFLIKYFIFLRLKNNSAILQRKFRRFKSFDTSQFCMKISIHYILLFLLFENKFHTKIVSKQF